MTSCRLKTRTVRPVFFFPDSPPDSQPINHVSRGAPPALLMASTDDTLVNPHAQYRQAWRTNCGRRACRSRRSTSRSDQPRGTLVAALAPTRCAGLAPVLDRVTVTSSERTDRLAGSSEPAVFLPGPRQRRPGSGCAAAMNSRKVIHRPWLPKPCSAQANGSASSTRQQHAIAHFPRAGGADKQAIQQVTPHRNQRQHAPGKASRCRRFRARWGCRSAWR